MALTELFLRSLGYSAWAEFDDSSPTHIQPLILWLENTKIRQYPLDGRAQLKTKNPVDWEAAFKRYLVDLGCPLEWGEGSSNSRIIHWLLSHASESSEMLQLSSAPPLFKCICTNDLLLVARVILITLQLV